MTISLSWMEPRNTVVEIGSESVQFHECSIFSFRGLREPLKVIGVALGDIALRVFSLNDLAAVEEIDDEFDDGARAKVRKREAPPTDSVMHVDALRQQAIRNAIDTFLDPLYQEALAKFVLDSLRIPATQMTPKVFVQECSSSAFISCVKGAFQANKEVFGPLGKRLQEAAETLGATSEGPSDSLSDEAGI